MQQQFDLDQYIADLRKRQQELFLQHDEIDSELDDLTIQLQMAQDVRQQIQRHFRLAIHSDLGVDEQLRAKYAPLTIKEMLVCIASENRGVLDLAQARRILVRAGVFKDERNAATSMAPILSRHEETFKRVGRGMYLLLPKPQSDSFTEVCPSPAPDHVSMLPGPKFRRTQPDCDSVVPLRISHLL